MQVVAAINTARAAGLTRAASRATSSSSRRWPGWRRVARSLGAADAVALAARSTGASGRWPGDADRALAAGPGNRRWPGRSVATRTMLVQAPAGADEADVVVLLQALLDRHATLRLHVDPGSPDGPGGWSLQVPEPGVVDARECLQTVDVLSDAALMRARGPG